MLDTAGAYLLEFLVKKEKINEEKCAAFSSFFSADCGIIFVS